MCLETQKINYPYNIVSISSQLMKRSSESKKKVIWEKKPSK